MILGTRGSKLALAQTKKVEDFLNSRGIETSVRIIHSRGDLDGESLLYEIGGKGVFTGALEDALVRGEIDLAIHSAKDIPRGIAQGTEIIGVLPRGKVEDVLIVGDIESEVMRILEKGKIGTGSLRRRAFLKRFYNSRNIVDIRGNVDTRLSKLKKGYFDALIFAAAALERLGQTWKVRWFSFDPASFIPSPNQGFIVVQARKGRFNSLFSHDNNDWKTFWIERRVANLLELDCRTPVGLYCFEKKGKLYFYGSVITPDGKNYVDVRLSESIEKWEDFPERIYEEFLKKGVENILEMIKKWQER